MTTAEKIQGTLSKFSTPAGIEDLASNPKLQSTLDALWNQNLTNYTLQSIAGDPWTVKYDHNREFYFNPITTNIPSSSSQVLIQWTAFPNRVKMFFAQSENSPYGLSQDQTYELVDKGKISGVPEFQNGFPKIPSQLCPNLNWNQDKKDWQDFFPPGPRGWQDEYSEFSVTRNNAGKITKVDFTCENPEYWFSLWKTSPDKVLEIYQQLTGENVQMQDLYLKDENGTPIQDPNTGQYAYNPLNKWNSGTESTVNYGGAVHLTSPPNTLSAEMYLAAAATLMRNIPSSDYNPQGLVCCSQYGQPFRNSDPHIGYNANQLVKNLNLMITLTNPVGLYIQTPEFGSYVTPDGTNASNFWNVVRGKTKTQTGGTYDQILHATFEVPDNLGYTVSDIQISGENINWASQIQQTFHIGLDATGIPSTLPPQAEQACPVNILSPNPWPQLLMYNEAYKSYNPNGPFVNIAPEISAGGSLKDMALLVVQGKKGAQISFENEPNIHVTVLDSYVPPGGGAPGKSGTYSTYVYVLDITVGSNVAAGEKSIQVTNPGMSTQVGCPGFLTVT